MRKRWLVMAISAGAGVSALWAVALAPAWACVPEPFLTVDASSVVVPGGEVTVKGADFTASGVELRWNALDGPMVGETTGPVFTTKVRVPETSDGVYLVVGLSRGPDGSVVARGSTPLVVQRSSGRAVPRPVDDSGDRRSAPTPIALLAGGLAVAVVGGFLGCWLFHRGRAERDSRQSLGPEPQE